MLLSELGFHVLLPSQDATPNFLQFSELMLVTQSCLTLCNPMDCSLEGSSVHGIFQARILEWVAIALSETYV